MVTAVLRATVMAMMPIVGRCRVLGLCGLGSGLRIGLHRDGRLSTEKQSWRSEQEKESQGSLHNNSPKKESPVGTLNHK